MGNRLYLGYNGFPPIFCNEVNSPPELFVGEERKKIGLRIEKSDRILLEDPLIDLLRIEEEDEYILMTALYYRKHNEMNLLSYEFVKVISSYIKEEMKKPIIIMRQLIDLKSNYIYEVIYKN